MINSFIRKVLYWPFDGCNQDGSHHFRRVAIISAQYSSPEVMCTRFVLCCVSLRFSTYIRLHWRHNERNVVSNHRRVDYMNYMNNLFWRRSMKTTKLRVTGLYGGIYRWPVNSPHKSPVTRKVFPFDDIVMLNGYFTGAGARNQLWYKYVKWCNHLQEGEFMHEALKSTNAPSRPWINGTYL